MTRRALWRGALAAGALVLIASAAAGVALVRMARALPPLDLVQAGDGSPVVLDREGRLLRAFTTPQGRWRLPIGLRDVDPRFLALLTAYEDRRFADHGGIDVLAVARAAGQALTEGHVVSGASTLTMQVARLLEPRAERSFAAKLRQGLRALELERALDKDAILTLYLALAPYGGNLEGIRAASLAWLGKEPKCLSHAEAALLVALPQSPETRRPDRFPEAARAARDRVLERAAAAGLLGAEEVEAARAEPVPTVRRPFPALAAHAAEAALREAPGPRVHRLALDARLQASLEALLRERVSRIGPRLSGAILVLDNATGEVLAHIGGPDFLAADRAGALDMTRAIRSPGSALKPFVYALAFEQGIAHPETLLDDRPARYGLYAPENFDLTFQGAVTARKALQLSLNVPAVELLNELGPSRLVARLRGAGAQMVMPPDGGAPSLAIALGGVGVTLADLTRLYAGFARQGDVPALRERLDRPPAAASGMRIADPVACWYVADILRGAPPPLNAPQNRLAYKTGTSYGYRDAWAVGFDKRFTVGVWIGRPDGAAVTGLVGRSVAAPILFDAFAHIGGEPEPLPAPPDALMASTASLPPPLRHLRHDAPKSIAAAATARLRIAYPPDGALIDLGLAAQPASSLALKAQGGAPPLTWLVNGQPLGEPDQRRQTNWLPDGSGFVRISVIDASGASDMVSVRLE